MKSNIVFIWIDFFKIAPHNGAMNYFDYAIGNDILSVCYKIKGDFCRNLGGVR